MELRICFEVSVVDDGEPCAFGMQMSLGETSQNVEYETLAKSVDIEKLISVACLDTMGVKREDIRIISTEEYDALYGDDEEDA